MRRAALALAAIAFGAAPAVAQMMSNGQLQTSVSALPVQPPFMRSGDPVLLPATTTPKQYAITQPPGTASYRGVNPCAVDVRIKTVPDMSTSITAGTGTRFLARTSETLGSTQNPNTGSTRYVSIMALSDPGSAGCTFELGYGNGG